MTKKITDLTPQQSNVNKHKEHGERLLRKSVQDYGIGDGITIAANDEAISGSMRIETLADMMPDVKIQIVETYGETLLVNKRMDIATPDTKMGRALSVASNSVAVADWNPDGELLKEWAGEDDAIRKMFADSEWREITEIQEKDEMTMLEKQNRDKQRNATMAIFCVGMATAWLKRNDSVEAVEKLLASEIADEIATSAVIYILEKYG
jgi:hypothetical protein